MRSAIAAAALLICCAAVVAIPAMADSLPTGVLLNTTTTSVGQPLILPVHPQLHVAVFEDPAGWQSGWHENLYPRYVYVLEGTLSVEDETGKRESVPAGHFSVEMLNRWHHGLNLGPGSVKFLVIDQTSPGAGPNMIMRSGGQAIGLPAPAAASHQ